MGARQPDVAIISSGHDVADARLHKLAGAFRRKGLAVEVRGLGEPSDGPSGAAVRTSDRGGMGRRAVRAVTLPWTTAAPVIVTLDPDVVPMARLAAATRGRKLVVDVHEDYARLLSDRRWARGVLGVGARAVVWLSTRLAAGADVTSVVDDHVPPVTAKRRLVIENRPDLALLAPHDGRSGPPRAVYVGDLRTSRGLFDMVEAVAAAPDWSLDLVGPVAAGDAEPLRARLAADDVAGRVRLHGRLPPAEAWQIAAGAWVGLIMLRDTPAFREAMPTKLYEYLASGLPALTTRLPRQAALVEESGAGEIVDGMHEAAAVLRRWSSTPAELDELSQAAKAWAVQQRAARSPYDRLADEVEKLLRDGGADASGPHASDRDA